MKQLRSIFVTLGLTLTPVACFAADSYRWLHVTIDTPWVIFLILLPMVLIPAVLMAILYWKFAGKPSAIGNNKNSAAKQPTVDPEEEKSEKLEP